MTNYPLINAVVFAVLGITIFVAAFAVISKFTPYHLWKEIIEERNVALAILVGACSIGICLIVAAAMH